MDGERDRGGDEDGDASGAIDLPFQFERNCRDFKRIKS